MGKRRAILPTLATLLAFGITKVIVSRSDDNAFTHILIAAIVGGLVGGGVGLVQYLLTSQKFKVTKLSKKSILVTSSSLGAAVIIGVAAFLLFPILKDHSIEEFVETKRTLAETPVYSQSGGPTVVDLKMIDVSFVRREKDVYFFKVRNRSSYIMDKVDFIVVGKEPGHSTIWAFTGYSQDATKDSWVDCDDDTIIPPMHDATIGCKLMWPEKASGKKLNIEAWVQFADFERNNQTVTVKMDQ